MTTSTPDLTFTVSSATFIEYFSISAMVLGMQIDGLTHADSLLQPEARGNCLNWIVGHIAVSRDHLLEALGADLVLGPAARANYARDTPPIITGDEPGVLPLETLVTAITQQQERIAIALSSDNLPELSPAADDGADDPDAAPDHATLLLSYLTHETMHVGQTEYLRQLTGRNDQVL